MANDISITIRIPNKIYEELQNASTYLGFTLTSFLRIAIFEYVLKPSELKVITYPTSNTTAHRLTLKINEVAYQEVLHSSKKYQLSINATIILLANLTLERYSKLLP